MLTDHDADSYSYERKMLIKDGADLEARDYSGYATLLKAVRENNAILVQRFISAGWLASVFLNVILNLFSNGANVLAKKMGRSETALKMAKDMDYKRIIKSREKVEKEGKRLKVKKQISNKQTNCITAF